MEEQEIWRSVVGYEGIYEISNTGRIKSCERFRMYKGVPLEVHEKMRTLTLTKKGYLCVGLSKNAQDKTRLVHQLVAQAFIPNPQNKPYVNHLNSIKVDNRVENLEWCTSKENQNHAAKFGRLPFGERSHMAKLSLCDVSKIRELYAQGARAEDIANQFSVHCGTVYLIVSGKSWRRSQENDTKAFQSGRRNIKVVLQLDENLNLIQKFKCQAHAAKSVGCRQQTMSKHIKEKSNKLISGYYWRHEDDYELREMTDEGFTVSVIYRGNTVFTKYKIIK